MHWEKFSEKDRLCVIKELEEKFNVRLTAISPYRKYLKDEKNTRYLICGGRENWHGFPPEIVVKEENESTGAFLVFASKGITEIKVFIGPLCPLIRNKERLKQLSNKQYQFNITFNEKFAQVIEIRAYYLELLSEIKSEKQY